MRYLNGGPAKLEYNDERSVIKEPRQIGSGVQIGVPAWQALDEDEGKGEGHQHRAQQMPTLRGERRKLRKGRLFKKGNRCQTKRS